MAKKSILDILINVVKKGDGDQKVVKGLAQVKNSVAQAGIVFAALAGAAYTVDKALDATVGNYVAYADQVRDVMDVTGLDADEASRLIQVLDDLGVSQEVLTKGMKSLADQGIEPNIENLAVLSDQYLALAPGVERVNFLIDHFGSKSGPTMALAMEQSGDALRKMNDGVRQSLILNDEGITNAREYTLAVDDLKESWQGMLITLGAQIAPPITDFLNEFSENISWVVDGQKLYSEVLKQAAADSASYYEFMDKVAQINTQVMATNGPLYEMLITNETSVKGLGTSWKDFYNNAKTGVPILEETADAMGNTADNAAILIAAEKQIADEARALAAGLSGDLGRVLDDHDEKLISLEEEYANLQTTLAEIVDGGVLKSEQADFENTTAAIADNAQAQRDLADSTEQAINKILYQKVAMHLSDEAALDYARSLGLISERDYALQKSVDMLTDKYDSNHDGIVSADEGVKDYQQDLEHLRNMLLSMPPETVMDVITNWINNGTPPPGYSGVGHYGSASGHTYSNPPPQAAGGGTFSGPLTGYPVTLHGTEAVIPLKRGAVPVSIQGGSLGGQTINIENINITGPELGELLQSLMNARGG